MNKCRVSLYHRNLRYLLFVFCCVASLIFHERRSFAEPLSLESFISEVKAANPSIQSAKLRASAQEHRVGPAKAFDDPFMAAGMNQIYFNNNPPPMQTGSQIGSMSGGSMNNAPVNKEIFSDSAVLYQISQSIPFPGKLSTKGQVAKMRAVAASADAESMERQITVVATQVFYRAYFNQHSIELNENLRKSFENTIESTKARYITGQSSHHEWLLAKVQLSILEIEKLKLQREKKTLDTLLNEIRNRPPETPIALASIDFDRQAALNPLPPLKEQPEFKALDASIQAADKEVRFARLSFLPDFVFQGMAMQPHDNLGSLDQGANWGFMVGLNIPVFFFQKQSELLKAAKNERQAVAAEEMGLQNRLQTEVIDAQQQLKTAQDVVDLYKKNVVPLTAIAANNATSGYAARRVPLSQLLETLRIQATQDLEVLAAQIDVELAKTRLRELLSSPPVMQMAPSRPTLFGSGSMAGGSSTSGMGGMESSDTVNLGRGMSGPTRKSSQQKSQGAGGSSSGMGGM